MHVNIAFPQQIDLPEFVSVTAKQWFQVEVGLDVFLHLLFFIKFNLDLEPLFRGH
jgi:hypothetical protein